MSAQKQREENECYREKNMQMHWANPDFSKIRDEWN